MAGRMWVEFWDSRPHTFVAPARWERDEERPEGWTYPVSGHWEPPLAPVAGKGYPLIHLEAGEATLVFGSTAEMISMAEVLERPIVDPVTSQERWYRKLPSTLKSKHGRIRTAALLRRAVAAYVAQLPEIARSPSRIPDGKGSTPTFRAEIRL